MACSSCCCTAPNVADPITGREEPEQAAAAAADASAPDISASNLNILDKFRQLFRFYVVSTNVLMQHHLWYDENS